MLDIPAISRIRPIFQTLCGGVSSVNLRKPGDSCSSTLINGRRLISGSPGDTGADIHIIPTEFIDRLELLTGGASAIYGSDANGAGNVMGHFGYSKQDVTDSRGRTASAIDQT